MKLVYMQYLVLPTVPRSFTFIHYENSTCKYTFLLFIKNQPGLSGLIPCTQMGGRTTCLPNRWFNQNRQSSLMLGVFVVLCLHVILIDSLTKYHDLKSLCTVELLYHLQLQTSAGMISIKQALKWPCKGNGHLCLKKHLKHVLEDRLYEWNSWIVLQSLL